MPKPQPEPRGRSTGHQSAATDRAESTTALQSPANSPARLPQPGRQALKQAMDEWDRDNPRHPLAKNEDAVNARAAQIQEALNVGAPIPDTMWDNPQGERSPDEQRYVDTMRDRGLLAAAREAGARTSAEQAVRRYEAAPVTDLDNAALALRDASVELERFLDRNRSAGLAEARQALEAVLEPGHAVLPDATNRLHAELVKALTEVSSRTEVETLQAAATEHVRSDLNTSPASPAGMASPDPARGLPWVDHAAAGTLVHGTSPDDTDVLAALKTNGFRWSRRLQAWYLPRNLTHETRDRRVASLVTALDGRIVVERPDGERRLTAAEKEAAAQDRASVRAERMSARAERLDAEADRRLAASDAIIRSYPLGQPVLLGHHSQAAHERNLERAHTHLDKGVAAQREARVAAASAERAEQAASGTEAKSTIAARIDRNEALVRSADRELGNHQTAQTIVDKLGADHPKIKAAGLARLGLRSPERIAQLEQIKATALDAVTHDRTKLEAAGGIAYGQHNVEAGDFIKHRGGWLPVVRANAKTVSVPTGYSWTDKLPWSKVNAVAKADSFSPTQINQLLSATGPDDKHRRAALQKALARSEAATETAAHPAPSETTVADSGNHPAVPRSKTGGASQAPDASRQHPAKRDHDSRLAGNPTRGASTTDPPTR